MAVGGGRSLSDMLRPSLRQHLADQVMKALLVVGVEWSARHRLSILAPLDR